jgi:hypothetical protein
MGEEPSIELIPPRPPHPYRAAVPLVIAIILGTVADTASGKVSEVRP